jgi:hypothetical protein
MYFGERSDSPPAHDLAYFRVDPCSRSDPNDRVLQCGQQPTPMELNQRLKTRTKLRVVGKVGAFTIYDLLYFFSTGRPDPGMRSVLIETAPNQFHEIHVRDRTSWGTLFVKPPEGFSRNLPQRRIDVGTHLCSGCWTRIISLGVQQQVSSTAIPPEGYAFVLSNGAKSCIFEMKVAGPGGYPVRPAILVRLQFHTKTATAITPTKTLMRIESSIMEVTSFSALIDG